MLRVAADKTEFKYDQLDKIIMYDLAFSPYPSRVHIALYEKGLHDLVETKTVDFFKGENKQEWFKQKNYSTSLPVFEFKDGSCLSETISMIEFIDRLGEPTLTGFNMMEQSVISMMTRKVENEILGAFVQYFRNAQENPQFAETQKTKVLDGFKYVDGILSANEYVCGDRFTQADIALVGAFILADMIKFEVPKHQALWKWYTKVCERPSIKTHYQATNKQLPQ